jgi:hypothetical protein
MNYRTAEGRRAIALLDAGGYRVGLMPRGLTAIARGVPRSDRGSFYVWSRDGSFPVIITRDFTDVARFAHAPPDEQRAIEEAMQQRWETEFDSMAADDRPDDRPWKVQEGGSEAEGFFVIGYHAHIADPVIAGGLFGPYSTLEDAQAVVAAKDPLVRPQDEELIRREREEADEWFRNYQKEKELPPPPESFEET